MRQVKYFKYSDFGPVTLYTGRMGSGLTLSAVIQIVKVSKGKNPPRIVSNAHLKEIKYESLDPLILSNYSKPSLYLFDSGYNYFSTSRQQFRNTNRLVIYLFNILRKLKSKAILTTSDPNSIDIHIRELITDRIHVQSNFKKNQKILLEHYKLKFRTTWEMNNETGKKERVSTGYWRPMAFCIVKRSGKYWKYYNSMEVPNSIDINI